MDAIFEVRNRITKIYKDYEFLFRTAAKFIFAIVILNYLKDQLGYYEILNLFSIRIFLSVVCAFIPVPFVVLVMGIVALLHLVKLSVVIGGLSAVVFIIAYFLYVRFAPSQGLFMLAIAALLPFNMHYVVAFILGMFYSPVTVIPAILTVVMIRFVDCAKDAAGALAGSKEIESILASYQGMVDRLLDDKTVIVTAAALVVIIVVAYVISRLPFDFSWYVAIAAAAVAGAVVQIFTGSFFQVDVNLGRALIGIVVGAVVAAFLQFMKCVVDYPRKEFVQFEDDDYYYYVRAIPKLGSEQAYTDEDWRGAPEGMDDRRADARKRADVAGQQRPVESRQPAGDRANYDTGRQPTGGDVFPAGGVDDYGFFDQDQGKF